MAIFKTIGLFKSEYQSSRSASVCLLPDVALEPVDLALLALFFSVASSFVESFHLLLQLLVFICTISVYK